MSTGNGTDPIVVSSMVHWHGYDRQMAPLSSICVNLELAGSHDAALSNHEDRHRTIPGGADKSLI